MRKSCLFQRKLQKLSEGQLKHIWALDIYTLLAKLVIQVAAVHELLLFLGLVDLMFLNLVVFQSDIMILLVMYIL